MIPLSRINRVQVQCAGGTWCPALMDQVEPGDVFRFVRPDGSIVQGPDGERQWTAKATPFIPTVDSYGDQT